MRAKFSKIPVVVMLVIQMFIVRALAFEVPVSQETGVFDGRPTIVKVYEVPSATDPLSLIEEDFEQSGYLYTMTGIVKSAVTDSTTRTEGHEVVDNTMIRYTITYSGSEIASNNRNSQMAEDGNQFENEEAVIPISTPDKGLSSHNIFFQLCGMILYVFLAMGAIGYAVFSILKYVKKL